MPGRLAEADDMAAVRFDYFVADDFGGRAAFGQDVWRICSRISWGVGASKIRTWSIQFRAASIWARSWSGMMGRFGPF